MKLRAGLGSYFPQRGAAGGHSNHRVAAAICSGNGGEEGRGGGRIKTGGAVGGQRQTQAAGQCGLLREIREQRRGVRCGCAPSGQAGRQAGSRPARGAPVWPPLLLDANSWRSDTRESNTGLLGPSAGGNSSRAGVCMGGDKGGREGAGPNWWLLVNSTASNAGGKQAAGRLPAMPSLTGSLTQAGGGAGCVAGREARRAPAAVAGVQAGGGGNGNLREV